MSDPPWTCLLFYQIKKLVRENGTMKNYKIAVAGTGYVGLSLGVLLSQHHQVVAVDIVQAKVDMINNKKSPIQDDYQISSHQNGQALLGSQSQVLHRSGFYSRSITLETGMYFGRQQR